MSKGQRKIRSMSPELKAMLSRPRTGNPLSHRKAMKLERAANKLLGRNGFFDKVETEGFDDAVHQDAISSHGNLRPTWQGRA